MLPALWVSKTGLAAQDMNLTTISNLAWLTSQPRVLSVIEPSSRICSRLVSGQAHHLGRVEPQPTAYRHARYQCVRTFGTSNVHEGSLQTTEQPLDMAVNGRGFFQVLGQVVTISHPCLAHLVRRQLVTSQGYS